MFSSCKQMIDIRAKLLENSKNIKGISGGKVTTFAYIGFVETVEGKIYVVNRRTVIPGMQAPRGNGEIMFYNSKFNFLGCYSHHHWPQPLWCENGYLFFFGRSSEAPQMSSGTTNNGNAIDLRNGWANRKVVDIYEYGSSGGINDKIPTMIERESELKNWDSK